MDRFHLHDCTHTRDSSEYAYMRTTVLIRNAVMAGMLFSAMTLSAEWNWQTPRPQGNSLRSVQFIDASHGWAAGEYGTILHTPDGGGSWDEQELARSRSPRPRGGGRWWWATVAERSARASPAPGASGWRGGRRRELV